MKIAWTGLLAAGAVACAARSNDDGPQRFDANPCATSDSTYLFQYRERHGGTCGALSDAILEVGLDHEVFGWSVDCAHRIDEACTNKRIDCRTHHEGRPCWTTKTITYAEDGSSVSGLLENACWHDHAWCVSTYDVTGTRL